jgi:phospholipid transport system substrate-binding protein
MRYPTLIAAAALLAAGVAIHRPARAAAASAAAQPAQAQQPYEVVQSAAQQTLQALDADRAAYRNDPAKLDSLVDKYLLPHFDTQLAAQLVLGPYWRKITPAQRQQFIDAFIHSMLNNYGTALLDFTANTLKVFPSRVSPETTVATVRTEVTRTNGARDSVNFYMRKSPQGWQAFDVVIDGISYVTSYREDFQSQIAQQGIEAVIKRLQSGERPAQISHITDGKS